jgi:fibronectin-binding autotransporter adhesin
MAQNYTRQSSFADGDTITAALFNNEFNQVVNAFSYSASSDSSTGHKHDGTSGQGGNIPQIGDIDFLNKIVVDNTNNRWGFYVQVSSGTVEQLRIQDGAIVPVTDDDIDLGTSSLEFKDLFLDGTAHIDTLDVDVNATVAGTLGVTGATTLSSTLGVTGATTLSSTLGVTGAITGSSTLQATTITATTAFVPDASDGASLGTSALEFSDLFLADGAVINFGADQDVSLTHVADTGLLLNSTMALQFNDASQYINAPSATVLDINATDEIELNATLVDVNANLDVSGTVTATGTSVFASLDISGDIDVDGTTNLDVVDIDGAVNIAAATTIATDNKIQFRDTAIYVNSSTDGQLDIVADTEVQIAATTVDINGAVDISGNLDVGGNLVVTGTTTFNGGTLTMGDAATDNVVFGADINSNIIPNTDDTYDLGSSSQEWRNLYIDGTANIDSLVADTADINGGTVDGVTIGGSSAGDITYANLSDGTITITAFADEDDMSSDSATLVPTQQSVKAYVDAQVTAQDLDIVGDTGTDAIDLDSETITFTGGTGITSVVTTGTVTHNIDSTVATLTGSQTLTNKSLTAPTLTGTAIVASLDISGDIDVDGTTNLDVVDIDGAVDFGSTTAHAGNATFADNAKAIFGAGSDLQIYHNGSNSYIEDAGTGSLIIRASTATLFQGKTAGESQLTLAENGAVTAYYDNAAKLATTATGIQVTGDIANASGDLTLDVAGDIILDADGADIKLKDGGTEFARFSNTGTAFQIYSPTSDKDITFVGNDGGSTVTALTLDMSAAGAATFNSSVSFGGDASIDNAAPLLSFQESGATKLFIGESSVVGGGGAGFYDFYAVTGLGQRFFTNSVERMRIDASGNLLVGKTTTALSTAGLTLGGAGFASLTRSGAEPLNVNRLSSDGNLAVFYKDGTTVGSIVSRGGVVSTIILDPRSGGAGLTAAGASLFPTNNAGAVSDGAIDLGYSVDGANYRFKDLYLSGSAYTPVVQGLGDEAGLTFGGAVVAPRKNNAVADGTVDLGASDARFKDLRLSGVSYNGDGSAAAPSISFGADTNTGFYRVGSDQIGFVTAGTIKAKLDASGNLLVGTTAANGKKMVISENAAEGIEFHPAISTNVNSTLHYNRSTSAYCANVQYAALHDWHIQGDLKMTLDANGDVGIGVTPTAFSSRKSLDIGLGGKLWGLTSATETGLGNNFYFDGAYKRLTTDYASRHIQDSNGHTFDVAVSGSADSAITWNSAMTIDTSGNLLVGTTTASFTSGGTTYTPKFATDSGSGNIAYLQTSGAGAAVVINNTLGSGDRYLISFDNGSTRVGDITSNGTATTYGTSSDYRLKENIADANDAGDKIDAIKVRQYDWKVDGSHQDYGMVAQELMTVAPEAVHQPEDPEAMMGVDYSKLVPMMLKEIQSLRARIAALES